MIHLMLSLTLSLCRCVFLFILMLFFRYFACVCVWTRRTSVKNQHRFTHLANWIFIFCGNFPFRWCRYFHYFIIWDGVWFTYFQSFMKWKTTEELLVFFFSSSLGSFDAQCEEHKQFLSFACDVGVMSSRCHVVVILFCACVFFFSSILHFTDLQITRKTL